MEVLIGKSWENHRNGRCSIAPLLRLIPEGYIYVPIDPAVPSERKWDVGVINTIIWKVIAVPSQTVDMIHPVYVYMHVSG